MPTNQMIHTYMGPGIFPQVGPLMVASNDLRPYAAVPKPQVPQPPRGELLFDSLPKAGEEAM